MKSNKKTKENKNKKTKKNKNKKKNTKSNLDEVGVALAESREGGAMRHEDHSHRLVSDLIMRPSRGQSPQPLARTVPVPALVAFAAA